MIDPMALLHRLADLGHELTDPERSTLALWCGRYLGGRSFEDSAGLAPNWQTIKRKARLRECLAELAALETGNRSERARAVVRHLEAFRDGRWRHEAGLPCPSGDRRHQLMHEYLTLNESGIPDAPRLPKFRKLWDIADGVCKNGSQIRKESAV